MPAPFTYTLTVVRKDGLSHSTTASGHYAESPFDKLFNELTKDTRTRYAMVHDGGSILREYWQGKGEAHD